MKFFYATKFMNLQDCWIMCVPFRVSYPKAGHYHLVFCCRIEGRAVPAVPSHSIPTDTHHRCLQTYTYMRGHITRVCKHTLTWGATSPVSANIHVHEGPVSFHPHRYTSPVSANIHRHEGPHHLCLQTYTNMRGHITCVCKHTRTWGATSPVSANIH